MIQLVISCWVISLACVCLGLTPDDYLINDMPGLEDKLNFKQYSGFMPLGDDAETHLFFWFVESQDKPSEDPLLYWTNGGPGSSSIAFGFWTEHGPFRLSNNGSKVELYDYSWNRHANVLYVDQPSGVGLSWSADEAHYVTQDSQASADNLLFLKAFFKVFPQFKPNKFYVTGESYGGHYVPQLSERILDDTENEINMHGFWIGNPGVNSDWYYNVDEYAFLTFMYHHGLLPQVSYQACEKECGWVDFLSACSRDYIHPSEKCNETTHRAWQYIPSVFDPYNYLAATCHEEINHNITVRNTPHLDNMRKRHGREDMKYNPCISKQSSIYMQRPDVLKALHAETHPNPNWPEARTGWSYGDEKADIMLLFPKFFHLAPHWKIHVVSGTADAAVPFVGTQREIECLNLPVEKDWYYWLLDGDVAGSIKKYKGLTFVTVKGCGHTIPTYCPKAGYAMLELFFNETESTEIQEII